MRCEFRGTTFSSGAFPGGFFTSTLGINNLGQIVGSYHPSNGAPSRGYVFDGTTYSSIEYPGAISTGANGINDDGGGGDYSRAGLQTAGYLRSGES